jgi:Protein of unknown function (DUF3313)
MFYKPLVLITLLFSIILSGCASMDSMQSQLKAPPSQGAGFVPVKQMAHHPDLPFNKAWVKQGVNWHKYQTIYIAPVNTDYLIRATWWQQSIRADQMQQDVRKMAAFMRHQFITAFRNDPQHRVQVVSFPKRGSLTLQLAITELVPSKVLLNAIKIAGPYGSGVAAAVLERGTQAQSAIAFEARVRDSNTGETLAMLADKEYAVARPIDLKGFSWYANSEDVVTNWSHQFVQVANRRPGQIVKPASTFSLKPW